MSQNLLLLRHAETEANRLRRFVGRGDPSLSHEGRRRASAAAALLQRHSPARCFCSPLRRCVETAEAAAGARALAIETDPDLQEIDFGRWEGMPFEEIREKEPEAVKRWAAFDPDFAFPGGERIADFLVRVRRAAERLAACSEEIVLAVTHGGVIRAMICHFLELDPRRYIVFDIRPAAMVTLGLFDGRGILTGLNLESGGGEV